MNEHHDFAVSTQVKKHQFITLLVGAIAIAMFLVYVAMSLYITSGTIQLDLSRPGYAEARKGAQDNNGVFRGFSSNGILDESALEEFDELYSEKLKDATSVNAFSGDALNDRALQLTE